MLGYDSGFNLRYGDENVFIGTEAGYRAVGDITLAPELRPSYSTMVGSFLEGEHHRSGEHLWGIVV